jgi:hypothetical protein
MAETFFLHKGGSIVNWTVMIRLIVVLLVILALAASASADFMPTIL